MLSGVNNKLKVTSKKIFILLVIASIFKIWLNANIPLNFMPVAYHDDAFFMRLAGRLLSGDWLGIYDPLVLAKGPGYAFFIAINNLLGLPISISHAIVHIIAAAVIAHLIYLLTKSDWFSAFLFIFLTLCPISVSPALERVIRDQIYWAQILLCFGMICMLLFVPSTKNIKLYILAALTGLIIAWTWFTREEGVLLLPSFLCLCIGAWIKLRNQNLFSSSAFHSFFIIIGACFISILILLFINNKYYGSYIGVDFKESNFEHAIRSIQSVDVGDRKPFVPASRDVLSTLTETIPSFKDVGPHLLPGGSLFGWAKEGCILDASACSTSIVGGWFVWALRDALAKEGYYKTPRLASMKYKAISEEIDHSCKLGTLKCSKSIVSFVPPLAPGQEAFFITSLRQMITNFVFPSLSNYELLPPNAGAEDKANIVSIDTLNTAQLSWTMLNFPRIKPLVMDTHVYSGWYVDKISNKWPDFAVTDINGTQYNLMVSRLASPDLVGAFHNERLVNNRFHISTDCLSNCIMTVHEENSVEIKLNLQNFPISASEVNSTVYIDDDKKFYLGGGSSYMAQKAYKFIIQLYVVIIPIILCSGLGVFLYFSASRLLSINFDNSCWWIALSLWMYSFSRIILLALIDSTLFPANNILYGAPVIYTGLAAGVFSYALLIKPRARDHN